MRFVAVFLLVVVVGGVAFVAGTGNMEESSEMLMRQFVSAGRQIAALF